MSLKNKKVVKSYHFFEEKEKNKAVFTTVDIEDATGWKEQTVKTYLTKKWDKILQKKATALLLRTFLIL